MEDIKQKGRGVGGNDISEMCRYTKRNEGKIRK
jgi:hypothetical protein